MAMYDLFWLCLVLSAYPYLLYPLLVSVCAILFERAWIEGRQQPKMTLIISVFNEEAVIKAKIENALALDYPAEQLEILVVSDGSTDATEAIAASYQDRGVHLCSFPERQGKTACLNRAILVARGELVVCTDANSMFPPEVLTKLAAHFADPEVGLVTGWTRYLTEAGVAAPVGLYARLEMHLKLAESQVASCVGADGAIFAFRKELYRPLADNDINDFVIPLRVIEQGRRVVLADDVCCLEPAAAGEWEEFRRQARITNRTLGAISRNYQLLNPLVYGWFALFLISHKLLRFLLPFFLLAFLGSSLWLAGRSPVFAGLVLLQFGFVVFAAIATWRHWKGRCGRLCSFFLVTLLAQVVGWFRWGTGRSDIVWTPQR